MHWTLFPVLALLVALVVVSGKAVRWKAATLSLLMLALSSWWLIDRLSGDGFNAAALYHMHADLEGAGISEFSGLIATFLGLVVLSLCALLLPRVRRFRDVAHGGGALAAFACVLLVAVAISPLPSDALRLYRNQRPVDYSAVAGEYVKPSQPIRRPRNIVWIYAESLERTYLDPVAFPGLTPNLTRLASQGLDVRDLDSVEGTGWTIAGMVASMCGVPLTTTPGDENSMGRMARFLPDADCLADYLGRQGYSNHFVGGADSAFAGKGRFLRSHGFEDVRDMAYYRDRGVAPAHFSEWGLHDDVLLEDAWQRFQSLSRAERPFMLVALTMDTHHPAGHLPVSCRGQPYRSRHGDIGLLHALKCSDRLIGALVDRIRKSPYADDTLIVVSSDHLAMPNDLSPVLADLHRENLLLFLGKDIAPRQFTASRGSPLDAGATLLQLLEPSIDAIGFGRSLLAARPARSASAAARAGDDDAYPRYLAYSRSLWTPDSSGDLRMDGDGRIAIGGQRVEPPVLLQYDDEGRLSGITLEDTVRQLARMRPGNVAAYVQRCIAFEDRVLDNEWCALLVDRERGARLVGETQLRRGVHVDAVSGRPARHGARARQPVTIANRIENADRGRYLLQLWTQQRPGTPFWLEAVSAQGEIVATHWVRPDALGRISLPLVLERPTDVLRLRAWLDPSERFAVERHALLPVRTYAAARKPAAGASARTSRSRG